MANQSAVRRMPSNTPLTPRGAEIAKPVDRYEDDATGINVEDRTPIDSRMPHMPPA
jgi:hypothetical protein